MKTLSWRTSLISLALAFAAIISMYWSTAAGMVEIWERSGTFTHAFLVPPISLWLIWRHRTVLAEYAPAPTPWLAVPLFLAGLLWLLGELAAVNVLTQFALICMIVLAVPLLLGLPLARAMTFPLLFLFFCVPFGEFLMPRLMLWTADITVLLVRLSGVPVYQEGLQFVIPSGHWSVVEACSGIRYLIASICVGSLFAYLNYSSMRRRLLFIAAAALVPLGANWLRAYGIVMLGHVSGNQLATGVDHLVYGWVFFGIVMTALFVVGMRWQEPEALPAVPAPGVGKPGSPTLALALLLVALALPRAGLWLIERGNALTTPTIDSALLVDVADWQGHATASAQWQPALTQPSAVWQRTYGKGGQKITLYVAYYRQQDSQRKLVSSENMLARSNDAFWAIVERGNAMVDGASVRTSTMRGGSVGSGSEQRLRVWQWYWIDGALTDSDIKAKLLTLKARLSGRGDDGAIIMLSAPIDLQQGAQASEQSLAAFSASVREPLAKMLANTREQR